MKPGRFDFPPVLHGDSFGVFHFQFVDAEDNPIDLTGAEVDLSIAKGNGSTPIARINGSIINTSAGEFQTENFIVELLPRTYWYDLTIYYEDGMALTYLQGAIRVLPNVKRFQIQEP